MKLMIRNIVKDENFLKIKSVPCNKIDLKIATDLKDTLKAHRKECVGMAANMIGYSKRMIIVSLGLYDLVMINPEIVNHSNKYKTEEGCLSLKGIRPCVRYEEIEVKYLDEQFNEHTQIFKGFTAQIIQHECDHLEGIII